MDFDIENHLYSIPSKFGAHKTMWIARAFHLFTIIFWVFFVYEAKLGFWSQLAVFFSAMMLLYEHYIVNKDFTKLDKAFFTVNGYLGFVFLFLIIMEVV
jgi:4-hydroxybenzoate polyprenyltransferase